MTIRNWIKFFFTALIIGGVVTAIVGLIVRWEFFSQYLSAGEYMEFLSAFLWMVFLGFTMSVVAQMGFFAYLTVHQFGVNLFKTLTLWNWVQLLIIAVVIFDLVFFRFKLTAGGYRTDAPLFDVAVFIIGIRYRDGLFQSKMDEKAHANFSVVFHDCHYDARMAAGIDGPVGQY